MSIHSYMEQLPTRIGLNSCNQDDFQVYLRHMTVYRYKRNMRPPICVRIEGPAVLESSTAYLKSLSPEQRPQHTFMQPRPSRLWPCYGIVAWLHFKSAWFRFSLRGKSEVQGLSGRFNKNSLGEVAFRLRDAGSLLGILSSGTMRFLVSSTELESMKASWHLVACLPTALTRYAVGGVDVSMSTNLKRLNMVCYKQYTYLRSQSVHLSITSICQYVYTYTCMHISKIYVYIYIRCLCVYKSTYICIVYV